jgi:Reverse transcriptase (RNA-dependent DNA polymerase)
MRKWWNITVKNKYPLPLISELINKLPGARYFTKLDVRWGFNNVWMKEGDEWKAAFCTNRGLFEPLVMFFSLTNSPATFQTMMDSIFDGLISEGKVIVYLDDVLVCTETLEEHREVVEKVVSLLHIHNLFLKPEKCEFERTLPRKMQFGNGIPPNRQPLPSSRRKSLPRLFWLFRKIPALSV